MGGNDCCVRGGRGQNETRQRFTQGTACRRSHGTSRQQQHLCDLSSQEHNLIYSNAIDSVELLNTVTTENDDGAPSK